MSTYIKYGAGVETNCTGGCGGALGVWWSRRLLLARDRKLKTIFTVSIYDVHAIKTLIIACIKWTLV